MTCMTRMSMGLFLVVHSIFDGIAEADEDTEFTLSVQYVEIYGKVRDLWPTQLSLLVIARVVDLAHLTRTIYRSRMPARARPAQRGKDIRRIG